MALIRFVWVVTTSSKRWPLGLTHSFLHSVLVGRAVSQLYPWNCFVTFPALTHSLHASGFFFFSFWHQCSLRPQDEDYYLNLLPSLNKCCYIHSTGPATLPPITAFSVIALFPTCTYFHSYWSFPWCCCCWMNFCTKQGGLPGLPLFVRPVAGGFHLCDDSRVHIADT